MPMSDTFSSGELPIENSQDDIVIAVMGSTGSGKSSFINLVTGRNSVDIGHTLESQTTEVQPVTYMADDIGRKVTIVDSPGFDDSRDGVTDTDILFRIAEYLVEQYNDRRKLNGLVFVLRISDPRFSGQSTRNLRMFRKLCGTQAFQNVVILTTYWDKVTPDEGQQREEQLHTQYFADLVNGGATFMKNDFTQNSVRNVLRHVLKLPPVVTQIQQEICEEGRTLGDTEAGAVYMKEIDALIARHKQEVAYLKAEMDELKDSHWAQRRELDMERDKLQERLGVWEREKEELKQGLENERSFRKRLEAQLQRDQTVAPQEWIERAVREARERFLFEKNHRSYRRRGMDLGTEIPFVPNAIGKPFVGTLGLALDIAKAVRGK